MLIDHAALLNLLQLASPALPVGAYSYSEGLETLVNQQIVTDSERLHHWLSQELRYGAIRLEAAIMLRAYQATVARDTSAIAQWNAWLSAARETEELRQQSWQMGRSLIRLLEHTQPQVKPLSASCGDLCNFAIAFGMASALQRIPAEAAVTGYLYSWATNLVNAGVKLIPLGQTVGQQLLLQLHAVIAQETTTVLGLADDDLYSCGWGLAIASMNHEVQYSRIFRS